jgi:hypothetical protein
MENMFKGDIQRIKKDILGNVLDVSYSIYNRSCALHIFTKALFLSQNCLSRKHLAISSDCGINNGGIIMMVY